MIHARNAGTSDFIRHKGVGSFKIHITSDGSVYEVGGDGGGGDYDYSIYLKHGWLMWAAWGILGLLQIVTNRYLKVFWKFNKLLHVFSGVTIFIITMTMGLLAMKKGNWLIEISWHTIMGFGILVAVGLIMIGGFLSAILMNTMRWNTALLLKIKLGHRVIKYLF